MQLTKNAGKNEFFPFGGKEIEAAISPDRSLMIDPGRTRVLCGLETFHAFNTSPLALLAKGLFTSPTLP